MDRLYLGGLEANKMVLRRHQLGRPNQWVAVNCQESQPLCIHTGHSNIEKNKHSLQRHIQTYQIPKGVVWNEQPHTRQW